MERYKERDTESTFSGTGSNFTVNDEKLKDPTYVANACNNFYKTLADNFKIDRIDKGDAIAILKYLFTGKFPNIQIIVTTKSE